MHSIFEALLAKRRAQAEVEAQLVVGREQWGADLHNGAAPLKRIGTDAGALTGGGAGAAAAAHAHGGRTANPNRSRWSSLTAAFDSGAWREKLAKFELEFEMQNLRVLCALGQGAFGKVELAMHRVGIVVWRAPHMALSRRARGAPHVASSAGVPFPAAPRPLQLRWPRRPRRHEPHAWPALLTATTQVEEGAEGVAERGKEVVCGSRMASWLVQVVMPLPSLSAGAYTPPCRRVCPLPPPSLVQLLGTDSARVPALKTIGNLAAGADAHAQVMIPPHPHPHTPTHPSPFAPDERHRNGTACVSARHPCIRPTRRRSSTAGCCRGCASCSTAAAAGAAGRAAPRPTSWRGRSRSRSPTWPRARRARCARRCARACCRGSST